jgi:hypothetical protein
MEQVCTVVVAFAAFCLPLLLPLLLLLLVLLVVVVVAVISMPG